MSNNINTKITYPGVRTRDEMHLEPFVTIVVVARLASCGSDGDIVHDPNIYVSKASE